MELLFVIIGAFAIGLVARLTMPHRQLIGVLLIPAVTTAGAAIVWEICLWAGLSPSAPWIWVITFGLAIVKAFGGVIYLGRRRQRDDAEALTTALRG
jgi:hypothetical protein